MQNNAQNSAVLLASSFENIPIKENSIAAIRKRFLGIVVVTLLIVKAGSVVVLYQTHRLGGFLQ